MATKYTIAPSILSADFAKLGEVCAARCPLSAALRTLRTPCRCTLAVRRVLHLLREDAACTLRPSVPITHHIHDSLLSTPLPFVPLQEVDNVLKAGADVVHFDVMDNHYVPNLTIGPMVCKALRDHGITAPIDVHLMVSPVDRIIGDFADAGASFITFHPEATGHIDRSLQLVRAAGC